MTRSKGSKSKISKKAKEPKSSDTYETIVEYNCPVRGKVKQKVKVKKVKPVTGDYRRPMTSNEDALASIEEDDNGLTLYDDGDEGVE